jgi:hypothetical protein
MKKPGIILLAGLIGCLVAFAAVYFAGTASSRELMRQPQPELAWLKKEFNLSEAEYSRIEALHASYLPQCAERCRQIEEQSATLRRLMAESSNVTPEIEAVILRRAEMRAQCESEMLKHFLQVSRTMPEAQGKRYLAWVQQQTFMRGSAMEQSHHSTHSSAPGDSSDHSQHHH